MGFHLVGTWQLSSWTGFGHGAYLGGFWQGKGTVLISEEKSGLREQRGIGVFPHLPNAHWEEGGGQFQGPLGLPVWMSRHGTFPLFWNTYVAWKKFHIQVGGVRRATPLGHPQRAGFDWVIHPLLVLSFPSCEVEVASQPLSSFSAQVGSALSDPGRWDFCR